ncbi:MAG TPA: FHA domain-containing protein [Cellvibrionaceae bacterium]
MLKLQLKDKRDEPILVEEKLYSIGSASDNNLVLMDPSIDPIHARLISAENGKVFIKDNTSANGSFVNGERISQKELKPGDCLRLGSVELSVIEGGQAKPQQQWQLVADGSWLAGQAFALSADKHSIIGRAKDCDIMIAGTHLSRHHAEVSVVGSSLRIRDLGSANGTFLNEQPIEDTLAHSGDRLRIDVYSFRIVSPVDERDKTRVRMNLDDIKAADRKTVSSEPKRWKTRPTSPGNRMEPTYQSRGHKEIWLWLLFAAGALVALLLVLLWVW